MKARQQASPPREDLQRFSFFFLFFSGSFFHHFSFFSLFSFFFFGGGGGLGGSFLFFVFILGWGVLVLPGWIHGPFQGYYQIILVVNER